MNGNDEIEIQEGKQMREEDIGDFLYDQMRDDKDIEKMEKVSQSALNAKFDDDLKGRCIHCGVEFDIGDLDRCDEGWICRMCEEDLK